jgi:hypothetical protein
MLGQNDEICFTRPTTSYVWVLITTISGVKLEHR